MLKSSLLEILRTFSKEELKKFEDFVRSPYFNKKEKLVKLFLAIKKYAPEFADANLDKEKVWSDIPNPKFKKQPSIPAMLLSEYVSRTIHGLLFLISNCKQQITNNKLRVTNYGLRPKSKFNNHY